MRTTIVDDATVGGRSGPRSYALHGASLLHDAVQLGSTSIPGPRVAVVGVTRRAPWDAPEVH